MALSSKRWIRILLFLTVLALLGGVAGGIAFQLMILRDLPEFSDLAGYQPPLASTVVDRNQQMIGEFFEERRRMISVDQIPEHVLQAFVSGEDKTFYEHKGIDYVAILRALWIDISTGKWSQGASTITMQTAKTLMLSSERTIQRKLRQAVLAIRLERDFTKDQILYMYLNQIYLGHGAYGIREAARSYYGKRIQDISASEAALIAGLPQRPSVYSPYRNPELAEKRRRYVLSRMHIDGYLTNVTYQAALKDRPVIQEPSEYANFKTAAYFTEEVRRYLYDTLGQDRVLQGGLIIETSLDLDLQRQAVAAVRKGLHELDRRQGYRGPLRHVEPEEISATLEKLAKQNDLVNLSEKMNADSVDENPALVKTEDSSTNTSDELKIEELLPGETGWLGIVTKIDVEANQATVGFAPDIERTVDVKDIEWARKSDPDAYASPVTKIATVFKVGDVARFIALPQIEPAEGAADAASLPPRRFGLFQEPIVEGALFSFEVDTGEVLVLVGGYDYTRSEFNRVTQAKRQPGSAFKPIVYASAFSKGYTPASIVVDRPVIGEDTGLGLTWRPQNYSRKFLGRLMLRTALVRSVNNATIHLFQDLGAGYVMKYARRLGIESHLERDSTLALGSSSLTLLELTRAYAVFPSGGWRVVPRFIRKVTDRNGDVLLENIALGTDTWVDDIEIAGSEMTTVGEKTTATLVAPVSTDAAKAKIENGKKETDIIPLDPNQIITAAEAYLTSDILRAVVIDPKGTGWRARTLGRPVGGKTGTTNEQHDAWFMGFSPSVVTGVWVGHDQRQVLGKGETGSRAALPIWVEFMAAALKDRPPRSFKVPDDIVFARIDRETGLLADGSTAAAYTQPFIIDTEPTEQSSHAITTSKGDRLLRLDSF